MISSQKFLKSLYDNKGKLCGKKNSRLISEASQKDVNTLFRVIHCIAKGHIPLPVHQASHMQTSKRLLVLEEMPKNYSSTKKSFKKRDYLKKLASLYHVLLYHIFEEPR